MTALGIVWIVLAVIWAADALRLRGRAQAIARLPDGIIEPIGDDHRFVCAPGVELDDATRRAASAFARREGLEVVDLIPADLPVWRALLFLGGVDPNPFRTNRFAKGRSAGVAMLVTQDVLDRAGSPPAGDLFEWGGRLKHYATTSMTFAIAPGLRAPRAGDEVGERIANLRELFGNLVPTVLIMQAIFVAAGLVGPFVAGIAGIVALALFQLQPLVAFGGTALAPRDLLFTVLLRAPLDLNAIARILYRWIQTPDPRVEARRAQYDHAKGALFEPHRDECPLCGGKSLELALDTDDLIQNKPGAFQVERCLACSHHFQNPRLSIDGLNYYYGDFYDGLGAEALEALFASNPDPYLARARMLRGIREPARWLDVGTGHGHFCLVAKDVWPEASFDGLDLSESIEDAKRRRWIGHGYRGLFPELAPSIAAEALRYDVVSMSHYLEHTRDPRAEIAAAHQVLPEGGALFIEVPDPDCRIPWLLGRHWISWFQPQHQHFLSIPNLDRVLREEGFEPVRWHRGEAHQPVDFMIGAALLLNGICPIAETPWNAPRSPAGRFLAGVYWLGALPLVGAGWALDRLAAPLFRRARRWSNTYRVVAVRR